MTALRVATVGGLLSFRGLFNWLHPAIFIPALVVPPVFQVVFFAYLGRAAKLESDSFYVVGNSIQLAALPGLFVMSQAITGERRSQTLTSLLGSPASRIALLLGRSIPVLVIGVFVSLTSFAFGVLLLDVVCGVNVPLDDLPGWMSTVAQGLPVTHAVEAGRRLVAGEPLTEVAHLLAIELGIGCAYLLPGLGLLRYYEREARRKASLDLM